MFENVAEKYDIMNDAMSLGIHRLWKDMLLHVMHPQPGARLLDVAGGTGIEKINKVDLMILQLNPPLNRVLIFHLQVTFLFVSWTTFIISKRDRSGELWAPVRRCHGRIFLRSTPLRTLPMSPVLWFATSTKRC